MEKTTTEKQGNKIKLGNQGIATAKGVHILTLCKAVKGSWLKFNELQDRIENNGKMRQHILSAQPQTSISEREHLAHKLQRLWFDYRNLIKELHILGKSKEFVIENITTTVGRSVLAQRLGGDTTYSGTVNYTALGDDNTAPVVGDATLGNEVYRKVLTSGTDLNNVSYLETFLTATEDADTYEEYGMYIDGAAGADTGQLFNRFTQQITKSNVETLNVQSIITFNDA